MRASAESKLAGHKPYVYVNVKYFVAFGLVVRARKVTAMEEFQAGEPAEIPTLEGDDTDKALLETPLAAEAHRPESGNGEAFNAL